MTDGTPPAQDQKRVSTIILFKTQKKERCFHVEALEQDTVYHLALEVCAELQKKVQHTVQLDCVDFCNVLTKNGRNKYQYEVSGETTIG